MTQRVRVQCFNVSRDGVAAGLAQSLDQPFGLPAPERLFGWAGATAHWPNRTEPGGGRGLDDFIVRDYSRNIGAEIMGRNKFGPVRGPWTDLDWQGWWGDEPPF
ncbi:MAG TPA: deaminase, partial [Microlunatus sp.]|nr:deaminase [Microlunatus sp.]